MKRIILYTTFLSSFLSIKTIQANATILRGNPSLAMSQQEIYDLAKTGNQDRLFYVSNIDVTDKNGITALCRATMENNAEAYQTLRKAGANESAACFKQIPKANQNAVLNKSDVATWSMRTSASESTFFGLTKTELVTGGLIIAAGIAIGSNSESGSNQDSSVPSGYYNENIVKINDAYSFFYGIYLDSGSPFNIGGNSYDGIGNITLTQNSSSSVFGIYSEIEYTTNNYYNGKGTIHIENNRSGDAYGLYSSHSGTSSSVHNASGGSYFSDDKEKSSQGFISIVNNGTGNAFGIYSEYASLYNAISAGSYGTALGKIYIRNVSSGNAYGMRTDNGSVYNSSGTNASGIIEIDNESEGTVYGIYALNSSVGSLSGTSDILIKNQGTGTAYGIYAKDMIYEAKDNITINNEGNGTAIGVKLNETNVSNFSGSLEMYNNSSGTVIGLIGENLFNHGRVVLDNVSGTAIGMYGKNNQNPENSTILLENLGTGTSVGMYATGNYAINSGEIIINNLSSGTAIGMYAPVGTTVFNEGTIKIIRTAVNNNGNIITPDSETGGTAYGIYAEVGATVHNTGVITLSGNENGEEIKLNGATLLNSGIFSADSINLDSYGGNVTLEQGGVFQATNNISGNLNISENFVQNGFQTSYTVQDAIDSPDVSKLKLSSKSVLFNAGLSENNKDVVLTMRPFDSLVSSRSLADFLTRNYTLQNNESFFSILKSIDSVSAFSDSLDGLTGTSVFKDFTRHDMSAMRKLNFALNQQMSAHFATKEDPVWSFSNVSEAANSKISNEKAFSLIGINVSPSINIGYGMAADNYETTNKESSKQHTSVSFMFPVSFQKNRLKTVSSIQYGYAKEYYKRQSGQFGSYYGFIERNSYSFQNEVRYSFDFKGINIEPSVQANAILYDQSGKEDEKAYSLTIPRNSFLSVESGLGLNIGYQKKTEDNDMLYLNFSSMIYREFASPYSLKVGMNGMNGTFDLYDEKQKYRSEINFSLAYKTDKTKFSIEFSHFIEQEKYSQLSADLTLSF